MNTDDLDYIIWGFLTHVLLTPDTLNFSSTLRFPTAQEDFYCLIPTIDG